MPLHGHTHRKHTIDIALQYGWTWVWWVIPFFGLQPLIWVPKMYMEYGELMIQIIVSPHSLSVSSMQGRIFFSPWWSHSTYLWANMRWFLLALAPLRNFSPPPSPPRAHIKGILMWALFLCPIVKQQGELVQLKYVYTLFKHFGHIGSPEIHYIFRIL